MGGGGRNLPRCEQLVFVRSASRSYIIISRSCIIILFTIVQTHPDSTRSRHARRVEPRPRRLDAKPRRSLDAASTQPRRSLDAASTLASTFSLDSLDAASTLQGPRLVTLRATSVKASLENASTPRRLDAKPRRSRDGLDYCTRKSSTPPMRCVHSLCSCPNDAVAAL